MGNLLTSDECLELYDLLRGRSNSKRDRKSLLKAARNGGLTKEELDAASSRNCLAELSEKAVEQGHSGLAAKLQQVSTCKAARGKVEIKLGPGNVYFVKLDDIVTIETTPPLVSAGAVYFKNSSGVNKTGYLESSGVFVPGDAPHLELNLEHRFYPDPGQASLALYHLMRDLPAPVVCVVQQGKAAPFIERFGIKRQQPAKKPCDYVSGKDRLTFFPGSGNQVSYSIVHSGRQDLYHILGPGMNAELDEDGLADRFRRIFASETGQNQVSFRFENLLTMAGSMIRGAAVVAYLDSRMGK